MIIVCSGGRDHKNRDLINKVLNGLNPVGVIVGDCPTGVDLFVREWCVENKVTHTVFKAYWNQLGLSAGPARNKKMVMFGKSLGAVLIAFKGNKGTKDCSMQAKAIGMIVLEAK